MSGWLEPYAAENAAELQHVLLAPGRRGRSHTTADDALHHFARAHGDGQPGAHSTALLLCTDWRWRGTTAPLIAGLEEGRLLDDQDLDELALTFLAEPTLAVWARKVDDGTVEVQLGERPRSGRRPWQRTPRMIPSPLRRWASTRALRRELATVVEVLAAAEGLDAADAAFVVAGMADAAPHLGPDDATTVVELAVNWGSNVARLSGLRQLAEHGDLERALALGRSDPAATVRRWADTLAAQPRLAGGEDAATAPTHDGQATLFG